MRDPGSGPVDTGRPTGVVGVVLAGGRGRRLGGAKAMVELGGKPLIYHALQTMTAALGAVAVLAKPDTDLPSLPRTAVWLEPQPHHHPLVGIRQALALADGRPVLVCAADLPFVTAELLGRLATGSRPPATAVIASSHGRPQPLLGRYEQLALELLPDDMAAADRPLMEVISELGPRLLEVDDPAELFNVNTPGDLLQAAALLDRRRSSQSPAQSPNGSSN